MRMSRALWAAGAVCAPLCGASVPALAQTAEALPAIEVAGESGAVASDVPIKEKYQLPQTAESITADKLRDTTNVVDTEDALKYFPSLFLRKRNYGDNQAVLATRTWGVSSSARSLVYADDILVSALIHNNNSIGAPRWGLIAPEEIERVDFLYGPFAAAYPGNSIGGVVQITTRMPDKPEASVKQTKAFQTFDGYGTHQTFQTDQTAITLGNRWNDLSMFVSANFQSSDSQPIAWVTTGGVPAGTTGTYPALNRTGQTANVVGAGLLHTDQINLKTKLAYDFTNWLRATYTIGLWSNDQRSSAQTYLRDGAGNATFGGVSGFASNNYTWFEKHLAQSLSLKSDTKGAFDFDIAVSRYDYLEDIQRSPFTVGAGTAFSPNGRIARLDGTNWTNADAKAIWRANDAHEVSFGIHADRYELNNPTYATPTWNGGPDATNSLYSLGKGTTQTAALWAQDAWRFAPQWKLTLGGRMEWWRAANGFNLQTTTSTSTGAITGTGSFNQPAQEAARFSPKASLAYEPAKDWTVTGSFGVANRFPTVGELYQIVTSGSNIVSPNPNLKPEQALSGELAIEHRIEDGKVRLSLFQENVRDALISQSGTIPPDTTTLYTSVTNVDAIRNRGIELSFDKDNVLIRRLEVFGSATYVDSRILSDPTYVSATGIPVVGKHVPNVPDWRATLGATYRPTDAWAFTVAGRYSGRQYATLDNTDYVSNVWQSFDSFFVVDARATYKLNENVAFDFGVDNINNEKYTLFHPFPQRTYVVSGRVKF